MEISAEKKILAGLFFTVFVVFYLILGYVKVKSGGFTDMQEIILCGAMGAAAIGNVLFIKAVDPKVQLKIIRTEYDI